MAVGKFLLGLVLLLPGIFVSAQKIVYSQPEKDDSRRINFEIAGKIGGNFLVYKNVHNRNWIVVFDEEMQQIDKVEQSYIPENDRLINVDFFPYADFCYVIYQYEKRNVVYCEAAKIDANGKKVSDVTQLDTTQHIGAASNNKIYTVLTNEDKGKIIVFKINSRNRRKYWISTMLFNNELQLQRKSRLEINMDETDDYLKEFSLDNDGNLVFAKLNRSLNSNIGSAFFIVKPALADSFQIRELNLGKIFLDEIHIKIDNNNKRYLLTSFYYIQRRGNIDGFYYCIWDRKQNGSFKEDTIFFSDELRRDAKGDNALKMAFNDHFIRNIIIQGDGGFLIASESYYTTSRYNSWNRWDYLYGSPFLSPYDYYYYSPYYNNFWWNSRYNNNQVARYHADNIAIFSFSAEGKLEWSNVISKSQFDDESDDEISFQIMNTGGQLHFLFNEMERKFNMLNDYTISPDGQLKHNPTLKNLDRGYEFMPKYGKQVSATQIIIPCLHRGLICFSKIDFN